jgi:putative FmdB family regulatory protein
VPIRAYEPVNAPCRLCGAGFEVLQKATDPALTACPRCGQSVRPRTASPVNSPQITKPTSISDAKAAGFTVLKRIGRGEFEKQ